MTEKPYNRDDAVSYAQKWAYERNPKYLDFENLGGDCTNFVSQCIFAGCQTMNTTKDIGWYYNSPNDRAAAWTSVCYLNKFLTTNQGIGPYGKHVSKSEIEVGDIIQLGNEDEIFYHSLIVVDIKDNEIYIACHSDDSYRRNLNSYTYDNIRYLHIEAVRA